jgi:hypothetical protein
MSPSGRLYYELDKKGNLVRDDSRKVEPHHILRPNVGMVFSAEKRVELPPEEEKVPEKVEITPVMSTIEQPTAQIADEADWFHDKISFGDDFFDIEQEVQSGDPQVDDLFDMWF